MPCKNLNLYPLKSTIIFCHYPQVGKEHLDLQVDRKKKQANGIHTSKTPSTTTVSSGTMDIPTVVVVGNNENRSSSSSKATSSAVKLPKMPKMSFSFGSSSPKPTKGPEAHQKASSSQIQIPIPDEVDGAHSPVAISVTKPEIIPRTKAKTSIVQKSAPAGDDMELVEAISPAIDKMTADFEKNKKKSMQTIKDGVASSAVLDVQPVEIDMSGQSSVRVESSSGMPMEMKTMKIDMPSADLDVRAPSMVIMSGDSKKKGDTKESKKKEKSAGKQKSGSTNIDLTLPSISLKGGGSGIEMKEGESGDAQDAKKPQRNQKSKDKTDKSKEKENKKAEKEAKEKESSEQQQQQQGETSGGEKSKFFKFGIPVLPDISWSFGKNSSATEDKDKDKEDKEKEVKQETTEIAASPNKNVSPKKEKGKHKEKSPEPVSPKENANKDDKKEKETKEKSSKDKNKEKEVKEKEPSSKLAQAPMDGEEQQENIKEASTSSKEKSGSSFSFNIKLPSFDKPLLKRKDSSSSTSGDTTVMPAVDVSPNATSSGPSDNADAKSKNDKSATETSPAKSKKKAGKEKKEKGSSRPTSPEVSEGHRTTDDEAEKSGDIVDMPGEKMSKKGGGFHMPHIGIKLPKFGHSKQTYSFENAGENKDIKHSHGPTAEALLESNQSMKLEVSANTPEFRKMTPTQDDIVSEVAVKMDHPSITEATTAIKKATDEVDSAQVKVDIDVPKVTLLTTELPVASLKVEGVENDGAAPKTEDKSEIKSSEEEMNKKEQENKEKEPSPSKEPRPSFVSKGLKGLRDLKDKVAHKLSHDHQQHSSGSSSEDEREPGDEKVTKEKIKKEKKSKESRDKSKEEKQREKEEKLKEKEKLKAEKKLRKAELKKKSATHSSSSSSSSSSDESDADDGKDKKEKKKLKTKEKSQKDKKGKKEKKEKSDKSKSVGIEVKTEMPSVDMQTQDLQVSTSIEQKQMAGHELKLIPAKPPVVPRKSRDTSKDESMKGAVGGETTGASKAILKKTKSKGGTSTSSSSSSSESDNEGKKDDREGKPKKPKRTPKRKAPEIPSIHTTEVPDIVKITTSAEVISPPREESGKHSEMRESSKTPESGRRSASFGDLSSLQQPKMQGDGILERAMSMDIAGDTEKTTDQGVMSVGSSLEDLSAVSDSKTITHLTRAQQQQQQQLQGLRDSMTSKTSSSSNETLKSTPTAVIQVHPKEQHELPVAILETSQVAPTAKLRVTIASEPEKDPQSSTVQQMMNETLSVMNNIVHEMDSPSLVKSAMNTSGQSSSDSPQVTISTIGTKVDDKAEAEKVAQETIDEILVKASQSLIPEVSASVNTLEEGPKVSVTTGDCNEPAGNHNIISDLAHSLSADMEGGADSFSIASVKIQGMDGDNEEPISVRNITVTNIKSEPKPAIVDDDNADDIPNEQADESANTSSSSDPNKQVKRGDSKARLLQTVADANEIKVAPATPLRKDSSLSSSSCSVDSSPDVKSDAAMMKPNFTFETKLVQDSDTDQNQKNGKANGQTIEISSAELDGIMMSHADFLQKQAAVVSTSAQDDSLDEPDQLHQKLKDTFDSWVYVEQKNAAHEHTCPHSHSDPEPSTSSSNDDDEGPYSRNGALSPTTYRMETEYKFETSEMRVTSSPIPPEEAHVKSQSTVYSTTMTLPQKTVTQITLGDPVMDTGGRIVSKITLDTSSQGAEDVNVKSSADKNAELPKLESLK